MGNRSLQQLYASLMGPARYGVDDCLLAAGQGVEIQTGRNPCAGLIGKWSSPAEAKAFEDSVAPSRLEAARKYFTEIGMRECDPNTSPVGSIGLMHVAGLDIFCFKSPDGWVVRSET